MKFLKKIISQVVSNIRSFSSGFYWGKKPRAKISTGNKLTEPLLKKTENTQAPKRLDPDLIAQALDPLKRVLPLESYTALSGTCQTLFKSSKGDANEIAISKLASHVLWNRPRAVTEILEAAKNDREKLNRLLTNSVTISVTLPSGLLFKGLTPFQAALCTWNTTLCEEFKKYFAQIPNGLAIMQAQITQIFPEGVEAYIEKQKTDAEAFKENILKPLIEAINAASPADVQTMLRKKQSNSDLGKAMTVFREKIKTLSGNEPVHNPFYLQAGFELYYECFARFRTKDQSALFQIQGIGCIQCYSPARDLQAFAQGLKDLVEEQKPFVGSFKFTYGSTVSHLEINMKDFKGLGFDYYVSDYEENGDGLAGPWPAVPVRGFYRAKTTGMRTTVPVQGFYRAKTTGITNFVRGEQQPAASSVMGYSFE